MLILYICILQRINSSILLLLRKKIVPDILEKIVTSCHEENKKIEMFVIKAQFIEKFI